MALKTGVLLLINPDTGHIDVDIKGLSPDQVVKLVENFLKGYKENLPAQQRAYEEYKKSKKQ